MPRTILAFIAACLSLSAAGANAAPQILALIETPQPVPLNCAGETCRAELSAFCLQQASQAPGHGTAYAIAEPGAIDLILSDGDGKRRRVPAPAELGFVSVRGYAAVTVSLPRRSLDALGAETVAVAVGRNASLLPRGLAAEGDPAAALALGAWRVVGHRVVEESGARIEAVRLTNALINLLPGPDLRQPSAVDRLWQAALAGPLESTAAVAQAEARQALGECLRLRYMGGETVQLCLQLRHDVMMDGLTRAYWDAVGAGS